MEFEPYSEAFAADPYPAYAALRESAPFLPDAAGHQTSRNVGPIRGFGQIPVQLLQIRRGIRQLAREVRISIDD